MWFNKPTPITLSTDLSLDDCLRRLRDETDEARRTIFALSGYMGSKLVLSSFDGAEFQLCKRRYYHNGFAPIFFGSLQSKAGATIIRGYFDMNRWTKLSLKIAIGFFLLAGTPIFIQTLARPMSGDAWLGLVLPRAMILGAGIFLPETGRLIGKGEERYIRRFLQTTLLAKPERATIFVSGNPSTPVRSRR